MDERVEIENGHEQWNIRDSGIGYVFKFLVNRAFVEKYNVEKVGGKNHTEWWIPSEKMEELYNAIAGRIEMNRFRVGSRHQTSISKRGYTCILNPAKPYPPRPTT